MATGGEILQEFEHATDKRMIVGRIEGVDEEHGVVEVSYNSKEGFKTFNVPHPHFSTTSWIRSMPEEGAYVLVGMTPYNQYPEILKVIDPSERVRIALNFIREIKPNPNPSDPKEIGPLDRVQNAIGRPDGLPFRKLRCGEHEVMSKGKAALWLSRRGYFLEKGGIVRRAIDAEAGITQDWAAGHERLGPDAYLQNQLWDSEYFGIVRRPSKDTTSLAATDLLNAAKISDEIRASTHIEDKVSSKVATLKAEVSKLSSEYSTKFNAFKLAAKSAQSSIQQSNPVKTSTPAASTSEFLPAGQYPPAAQLLKTYPNPLNDVSFARREYDAARTKALALKPESQVVNSSLPSDQNIQIIKNGVQALLDRGSELSKTIDLLTFNMGQLKVVGAGFQYTQDDFDLAQAQLVSQKSEVVNLCGKLSQTTILEAVKDLLVSAAALVEIKIPVYNVESAISSTFQAQTTSDASFLAKIQEAQAEAKIFLDNSLEVTKNFVYPEVKLEENEFCKEWRVSTSWKGSPGKLYEHVIGQVFDQAGNRETNPVTNSKTRSRRVWWADKPNQSQSGVEWIDGDGNWIHFLANSATKGRHVVIPSGSDYLDIGSELDYRVGTNATLRVGGNKKILVVKDLIIEAENIYQRCRGTYQVDATQIILNQNQNSVSKMTRTIQQTADTSYDSGSLIQSAAVSTEKILINETPKRRFVVGNPLLSARLGEIEDALTTIGSNQSSIKIQDGGITAKVLHSMNFEAEESIITKGKKSLVQKTDGSAIRQAGQSLTDSAPSAVYPRLHGIPHNT